MQARSSWVITRHRRWGITLPVPTTYCQPPARPDSVEASACWISANSLPSRSFLPAGCAGSQRQSNVWRKPKVCRHMLIPSESGAAMLRPRAAIQTLPSYHPPLGGRNGLRFDFNENTVGCSPQVLERLRQVSPEELARYPEREPVEATVAAFLGITVPELLLTNGVDEAIHL